MSCSDRLPKFFVVLRCLKLVRVGFQQANPFDGFLEEAEETAGVGAPPLEVRGHPDSAVFENSHDPVVVDALFLEREHCLDIGLGAEVALPVFIRSASPHN